MKYQDTSQKFIGGRCLYVALLFSFLSCGGGTTRGANGVAVEAVTEALSSSLQGALVQASSSTGQSLRISPPLHQETDPCTLTGSETDFTIVCPCESGTGTTSLHFTGTSVRDTCEIDGTEGGLVYSFSGTMDTTFEGCQTLSCGETVQIDGTVGITLDFDFNSCDGTDLYTTTQQTTGGASSCNGLTVIVAPGTAAAQTFSIGLEMTITSSGTIDINETELIVKNDTETSGDTFEGAVCVDGETTNFDDLDEFNALFDADDICQGP